VGGTETGGVDGQLRVAGYLEETHRLSGVLTGLAVKRLE
jgi:hypothetical protein